MSETYRTSVIIYCDSVEEAKKTAQHFDSQFGKTVTQFRAQVTVIMYADFKGTVDFINEAYKYGTLEITSKQSSF